MAKIPFSIDYRPQIESGEYKVETGTGLPVRIICWDAKDDRDDETLCWPIIGLVDDGKRKRVMSWNSRGLVYNQKGDLFIITPEPELSEFEEHLKQLLDFSVTLGSPYEIDCIKSEAAELLELARKELVKEGTSKNEMGTMLYDAGFEDGKAEALKDLPRWKKIALRKDVSFVGCRNEDELFHKGRVIALSELEKLPGFNED